VLEMSTQSFDYFVGWHAPRCFCRASSSLIYTLCSESCELYPEWFLLFRLLRIRAVPSSRLILFLCFLLLLSLEAVLCVPYNKRIPKIRIRTSQTESYKNSRIRVEIDNWEVLCVCTSSQHSVVSVRAGSCQLHY